MTCKTAVLFFAILVSTVFWAKKVISYSHVFVIPICDRFSLVFCRQKVFSLQILKKVLFKFESVLVKNRRTKFPPNNKAFLIN